MIEKNSELVIFDFAKALALASNNKSLLKNSLNIFIENIKGELNSLNLALNENDIKTITKIAHKINGSSGYLAALQVTQSCTEILLACETQNLKSLQPLIDNLHQQVTIFLSTLKTRKVLNVLS